jgi:hypothetical protein
MTTLIEMATYRNDYIYLNDHAYQNDYSHR